MLEASQHYQVVLQYEKLILILRFAKDLTEKLKKKSVIKGTLY